MDMDERFLKSAERVAERSQDNGRKVGCVFVREVGRSMFVVTEGYNRFATGVRVTSDRIQRPRKYRFTLHDVMIAIADAARTGISLHNTTVYTNTFPCAYCASMIVETGIKRVVTRPEVSVNHNVGGYDWEQDKQDAIDTFADAGVFVRVVPHG